MNKICSLLIITNYSLFIMFSAVVSSNKSPLPFPNLNGKSTINETRYTVINLTPILTPKGSVF